MVRRPARLRPPGAAALAWLDGWIAGAGRDAQHRVHFSWHAALHELAEGDADAVRRRYAAQLAPHTASEKSTSGKSASGKTASGVRLLVDSASLLWRGSLDSVWTCDAPIQPVLDALDASDPALLTEPPSRFTALHAALALATARDVAGLARLRLYAVSNADPVFPTVLAPERTAAVCTPATTTRSTTRWCRWSSPTARPAPLLLPGSRLSLNRDLGELTALPARQLSKIF